MGSKPRMDKLKRLTSAEVRQARAFLYKRGARTVPPDEFAGTAKDMALSFAQLWNEIWKENQCEPFKRKLSRSKRLMVAR